MSEVIPRASSLQLPSSLAAPAGGLKAFHPVMTLFAGWPREEQFAPSAFPTWGVKASFIPSKLNEIPAAGQSGDVFQERAFLHHVNQARSQLGQV